MLGMLAYLISAVFLFFFAIEESISDWNTLGWGLFFLVVGHLLSGVGDMGDFRGRWVRRD